MLRSIATMAWLPWVMMICGGAGTRLGWRGSVAVTRDRVGLRPSSTATKRPSSSALLLGWLLLSLPPVSSVVCPSCKDTIPGCKGGADCPLLKTPLENAATLILSNFFASKVSHIERRTGQHRALVRNLSFA